jgi:hypothetical protein
MEEGAGEGSVDAVVRFLLLFLWMRFRMVRIIVLFRIGRACTFPFVALGHFELKLY